LGTVCRGLPLAEVAFVEALAENRTPTRSTR
jgi:hypothetical protein